MVLSTILSLHPTTYNWKYESDDTIKMMGFIAQEVEEILPGLVITDEETGYLQLSTIGMIPVIVQAIKDQNTTITANTLKTNQNISTLGELQTSVDDNLAVINQTLTQLDNSQIELKELIISNTENLASLSESINSLTDLTTTITDTVTNHETRIAQLETILVDQGIELDQTITNPQTPNLENIPESLETLASNLTIIQEEDTDEDGNTVPKQIFSLSGDLIVERLKARKIEAEEITIIEGENKTIGVVTICPVGYRFDEGECVEDSGSNSSDGRSVFVESKIVNTETTIFTAFENNPGTVSWVEKIIDVKDKPNGFVIKLKDETSDAVKINWWMIKKK